VPEHKTVMVLRAPNFETARRLMVESGIVQTSTVHIYITESIKEFSEEIKKSTSIF
jgi:predicted rRNA methylase YqxC with S4 and FtsJ domains